MNFSKPDKVNSVISNMETGENLRQTQRALLNAFFNGDRPWTEQEAKDNHILFNFNDKSGAVLLHQARGQYENAFLKPGRFFTVQVDAPPDKASRYGVIITNQINRILKRSRPFLHTMRSKFAGVVLHGVGPQIWWDDQNPIPSALGIQDVLVPTDTEVSLDNLQYFCVRRRMRPGELFKKTYGMGKNVHPGWQMDEVKKILAAFKELNQNPSNYDWSNHAEQMTELYKQNLSYYDSDSAPVVWFNDFYYREEGSNEAQNGWHRCLLLDKNNTYVEINVNNEEPKFIFKGVGPVAPSLDQIIHFQFADGNNVPPFVYHSVRSLAYLLYELLFTLNRLNCQFTQHVFEQLMTWFRIQDPNDRSRLEKIMMSGPYAAIPEGLAMVTSNERYKVEPGLVSMLQAQYRQRVSESTSAYTQNPDSGTQKERTKFEVEAIMAQISSLMSSMLNFAYNQEYFSYVEICRRFSIENSHDFNVKHFRSECIKQGVEAKYLDSGRWEVIPEQVLGSGNKVLELAQARELRSMRQQLNPNAQQEVDRIYIDALTSNPRLSASLVPDEQKVSDATHDAELAFGTLMQGIPVSVKEGLNHIEQVAALLKMMEAVVQRIQQTGGMGTQQDIVGLKTAAAYTAKQIGIIAQDPDNKAIVKQFGDGLGNIMNMVKAFSQRQLEAQQAQQQGQQGPSPEEVQKLQAAQAADQQKLQAREQAQRQKMEHKQQSFVMDQARKNASAVADAQRKSRLAAFSA